MENLKIIVKPSLIEGVLEVGCEEYFGFTFFTLLALMKRQEDIYKLYEYYKETDFKEADKCKLLYEITEHMRVALLENRTKNVTVKKYN